MNRFFPVWSFKLDCEIFAECFSQWDVWHPRSCLPAGSVGRRWEGCAFRALAKAITKKKSLFVFVYIHRVYDIYIYRILYNYIVQYMYIYTSVYYYPVVSELMATAMCGTSAYKWNSTDELWDQDALESQRLAAEHKRFEEGGIAGEEVWSVDTLSFLPHIVRVKSRKLASAS
jgi:hypothetical protein